MWSHATAQRLTREGRPSITMLPTDIAGVQQVEATTEAGQTAVATVDGHKYAVQFYEHPKKRGKPPKFVRILSNVCYGVRRPTHHMGWWIHPLIAVCRQVAGCMDSANHMVLQMHLLGRQMSWSRAEQGFLLRYAVANVFATCRALEQCRGTDSIREWQCPSCAATTLQMPVRAGSVVKPSKKIFF